MSAPVVIVAGAGGAGAAAALRLISSGAHVVVLDRQAASAEAAARSAGGSAEGIGIDLTDLDQVSALRDDLMSRLGRIDAVVHLVGGWKGAPELGAESVANWRSLREPIVDTLAVLTAACGSTIRSAPAGRIVMVTSTTAAAPTVSNIAYAAAKRAAEGWMDGLADYFRDSPASAVTLAVKALLTDAMIAAEPERDWNGYTHVDTLASTIADVCLGPAGNGSRIDLTTHLTT